MHDVFVDMLAGNAEHAASFDDRFDDVQEGQHPAAVTVCCADSRVLQDAMWRNEEPGHLFTCSNIGNRVLQRTDEGRVVSGDVLYPIAHTGTETAVVVGHTGCGAVTATYDALTEGVSDSPGIEHCISVLEPMLADGVDALPSDLGRSAAINHLVEYNVDRQVEALRESGDVPDAVAVYGVVYDFQDVYGGPRGTVQLVNVDGERDPDTLREQHSKLADHVHRLWTY